LIQFQVIVCGSNREMRYHFLEFSTIWRSVRKRTVDGVH
jgi:hypothetical protein